MQLFKSEEDKEVVDDGAEDGDEDGSGDGEVAHGAERCLIANDS